MALIAEGASDSENGLIEELDLGLEGPVADGHMEVLEIWKRDSYS